MSKNVEFGKRMKRARETQGLSRERLAQLAQVSVKRIELAEIGQIDESDFTPERLAKIAEYLQQPVGWLVTGVEPARALPTGVIARRSTRTSLQGSLDFDATSCPSCGNAVSGARCDGCGRSPE